MVLPIVLLGHEPVIIGNSVMVRSLFSRHLAAHVIYHSPQWPPADGIKRFFARRPCPRPVAPGLRNFPDTYHVERHSADRTYNVTPFLPQISMPPHHSQHGNSAPYQSFPAPGGGAPQTQMTPPSLFDPCIWE